MNEVEMGLWLKTGVAGLGQEAHKYMTHRGFTEKLMNDMCIGVWRPPLQMAPDVSFRKRFGSHGEKLKDRICVPLFSPLGKIIGLDTRSVHKKEILGYRMPSAKWNPIWMSSRKNPYENLRKGGLVWVVEGMFDLAAIDRVALEKDVVFSTMRAGMSKIQCNYLQRYAKLGVTIVYDNDEAGKKASGIAKTMLEKRKVPMITLASYLGKDPGEIWLKQGQSGLEKSFYGYSLF